MMVGKRGDVVIFYTHHTLGDRLISLGEHGSPFTHSSVVTDDRGDVVEATFFRGVAVGHLPADSSTYLVLDPRTLGATEESIAHALTWLIVFGTEKIHYGFSDIAYQVVKYLGKFVGITKPLWHKDDEPDCSDLCCQYLLMAGAHIPWTVDTCYQVTPADLADLVPRYGER